MRAMRDIEFPLDASGSLDLVRADDSLRTAATQWIANSVSLYENGVRLETWDLRRVRVSLPSDRSFSSYDDARAHVSSRAGAPDMRLPWDQGLLDVWLVYAIRSDRSEFGIRVMTVLRFLPPGGGVRAFELIGDPGLVRLDPRWHQAALRFVGLGFRHILEGADHLLFVLCLVIPLRRLRPLIVV